MSHSTLLCQILQVAEGLGKYIHIVECSEIKKYITILWIIKISVLVYILVGVFTDLLFQYWITYYQTTYWLFFFFFFIFIATSNPCQEFLSVIVTM